MIVTILHYMKLLIKPPLYTEYVLIKYLLDETYKWKVIKCKLKCNVKCILHTCRAITVSGMRCNDTERKRSTFLWDTNFGREWSSLLPKKGSGEETVQGALLSSVVSLQPVDTSRSWGRTLGAITILLVGSAIVKQDFFPLALF